MFTDLTCDSMGVERERKRERKKERWREERADRNRSRSTIAHTGLFLLFACVETPHSDFYMF